MENAPDSQSQARTRILIVEDQVSMREMLAHVLSRMPEYEVVGQAENLGEAVEVAINTQPDVVILDWVFPGGGGLGFLRAMGPNRLRSRVLVLTGNTNEVSVEDALSGGARGFFEKGGNLDEFLRALRAVAAGGAYFGPLASGIVQQLIVAQQVVGREESATSAMEPEAGGTDLPSLASAEVQPH